MRIGVLVLSLLLTGCRTVSLPPDDRPFAEGDAARALRGCFSDEGRAAVGEPVRRLSTLLWPDVARDPAITLVSFEPSADVEFSVRAIAGLAVVRERTISASGHRSGPIRLAGGTWFSPFWNQGDEPPPIVGPYSEKTELGLDTAGDLELRRSGWVVGLAFLVVPMAISYEEQFRFPRVTCPESN